MVFGEVLPRLWRHWQCFPGFAPLQLDPIQSQNAMFTGLRHGSALHAYVGSHGTAAPRLRWFKRQIAPYYQGRGSKNLFSLSD